MLKRIWKALLQLFDRKERRKTSATQAETPPGLPDENRRIRLLTSGLKPYRRTTPEIKRKEVADFGEAYRFWIRLCGTHAFTCGYRGGHLVYKATLQEAAGTLELIDRKVRKDTVATIRISGSVAHGLTKEIRFILSNEKKTEQ